MVQAQIGNMGTCHENSYPGSYAVMEMRYGPEGSGGNTVFGEIKSMATCDAIATAFQPGSSMAHWWEITDFIWDTAEFTCNVWTLG